MNQLQQKSLELLKIVIEICDKWDIKYYLVCGTALGAVKYGGFIPWDDDIDVGFPRPEYERFLEVAPAELPEWCFLQNYKTEKMYPYTFSKLRNSNTAFIQKGDGHLPLNHGIYVDIFPLDGHPGGRVEKAVFNLKKKIYTAMRMCLLDDQSSRKIIYRNKLLRAFGVHKRITFAQKQNERLYRKYSVETSELWCNYGNWQGVLENAPKWQYGEGAWAEFEGLKVRIPERYDEYLTQKYGDWRSDPPEDKQKSHHIARIVDTEKSYTYYTDHQEKGCDFG